MSVDGKDSFPLNPKRWVDPAGLPLCRLEKVNRVERITHHQKKQALCKFQFISGSIWTNLIPVVLPHTKTVIIAVLVHGSPLPRPRHKIRFDVCFSSCCFRWLILGPQKITLLVLLSRWWKFHCTIKVIVIPWRITKTQVCFPKWEHICCESCKSYSSLLTSSAVLVIGLCT